MKKWKIGDKVKFLDEKGGGIITAIKDHHSVIVQLPDGMEIPYAANQLIPDDKNIIITSNVKHADNTSTDNQVLYLAIEGNSNNINHSTEFNIYLYNLSEYHLYYTYSFGKSSYYQCLAHGKIQAFEKQRIKTISQTLLRDIDACQIQILFYQDNLFIPQSPVLETIKLNEKTFNSSHFIQHPDFDKPVYIVILKENFNQSLSSQSFQQKPAHNIKIHLTNDDIEKLSELKEKIYYNPKHKQNSKKYQEHITLDLHIEELVESPAHLTPHQKLQIQLDYFERELYNAIANNVKKITVIHGVGNGRLKYEVREYLKNVEEVKSIEDAPYKTHGFGATVIYLK